MSAASVTLADRRDIMRAGARRPGVRADGNLCSLWPASERDRVGRRGKQVVRNEFVKAFIAFVDQIELNDTVLADCFTPNRLPGFQMQTQNRLKTPLHFGAAGYFIQRRPGQIVDNLLDEDFVGIGFNY